MSATLARSLRVVLYEGVGSRRDSRRRPVRDDGDAAAGRVRRDECSLPVHGTAPEGARTPIVVIGRFDCTPPREAESDSAAAPSLLPLTSRASTRRPSPPSSNRSTRKPERDAGRMEAVVPRHRLRALHQLHAVPDASACSTSTASRRTARSRCRTRPTARPTARPARASAPKSPSSSPSTGRADQRRRGAAPKTSTARR